MNRTTRLMALVLAFVVALVLTTPHRITAQPAVSTFRTETFVVRADTLGRAATDTVFTDSVNIQGARAVYLVARSATQAGTTYQSVTINGDSMQVPILQTRMADSRWSYVGGTVKAFGVNLPSTGFAATTAIDGTGVFAQAIVFNDGSVGTPYPGGLSWIRWRVRGGNARPGYPSGVITLTAVVVRY